MAIDPRYEKYEKNLFASQTKRKADAYHQFEATSLFCPHCRAERPVRKKLLLVLPGEDRYDYCCTSCGKPIGSKIEPQQPGRFSILHR